MAENHTQPKLDEDSSWLTPFLDVLLILIVVLLPLVHPPTKASDEPPPGVIAVEVRWPDACKTDVDLWLRAPGDRPVGYSAPSGQVFNLLRDDRGNDDDLSRLNYENAYSRGMPAGEYAINLHLYAHRGGCEMPVPVDVRIVAKPPGVSSHEIFKGRVNLSKVGEEMTVTRFALDKNARASGFHDIPVKLRKAL